MMSSLNRAKSHDIASLSRTLFPISLLQITLSRHVNVYAYTYRYACTLYTLMRYMQTNIKEAPDQTWHSVAGPQQDSSRTGRNCMNTQTLRKTVHVTDAHTRSNGGCTCSYKHVCMCVRIKWCVSVYEYCCAGGDRERWADSNVQILLPYDSRKVLCMHMYIYRHIDTFMLYM